MFQVVFVSLVMSWSTIHVVEYKGYILDRWGPTTVPKICLKAAEVKM